MRTCHSTESLHRCWWWWWRWWCWWWWRWRWWWRCAGRRGHQLTVTPRLVTAPHSPARQPAASQQGRIVELLTKFRENFIVSLSASSCTYSGSAHFIKDIMADNRNDSQAFKFFYDLTKPTFGSFKLVGPLNRYDNHVVTITLADLNLCPGAYRYRVLIGSRCKN